MATRIHPHALQRIAERGVTQEEAVSTVEQGEPFPAKFERRGFRRNFPFEGKWRGKSYRIKQVEAYAVSEGDNWVIITVISKYF